MAQSAPLDLGIPGLEDAILLGRGGFAVVYRAYQPAFRRTVAVKVVSVTEVDQLTRERFSRECQAMGLLSEHPSILTVLEAGFLDDGRPFLVTAYMPEGSLQDRLRQGPLGWQEATRIGVKLAGALGTAHQAGVLHRDVKPANVLVSQYGEPQLADFGIARVAGGQETSSGVITASLSYAPPEIVDGQRPSVASDVYALGATIHALMAGAAPFWKDREDSVAALINRVMSHPPPDLRELGVPGNIAEVLEQSMAKDPQDRPSSAAQFGRLLRLAEDENGLRPTQMTVYKPADEPLPVVKHVEPPPTEVAPASQTSEDLADSPTDVVDTDEMLTAAAAAASLTQSPPVEDLEDFADSPTDVVDTDELLMATAAAAEPIAGPPEVADEPTEGLDPAEAEVVEPDAPATPDLTDDSIPPRTTGEPAIAETATVATAAGVSDPPDATADLVGKRQAGREPEPDPAQPRRSMWVGIAAVVALLALIGGFWLLRGSDDELASSTNPTSADTSTPSSTVAEPDWGGFEAPQWWTEDPILSGAVLVDADSHIGGSHAQVTAEGASVPGRWEILVPPRWSPEYDEGWMTVETPLSVSAKSFDRKLVPEQVGYATVFRFSIKDTPAGATISLTSTSEPHRGFGFGDSGEASAFTVDEGPEVNWDLERPISLEPGVSYDLALVVKPTGALQLAVWPSENPPATWDETPGITIDPGEAWTLPDGWNVSISVFPGGSLSIDEYWAFTLPDADSSQAASTFDFPEWWLADPDWSRAEQVDHATHDRFNFVAGNPYGEAVWWAGESPDWSPGFGDGMMTIAVGRGEMDYEGVPILGKRLWRSPPTEAAGYAAVYRFVINELGDGLELFIESHEVARSVSLAVAGTGDVTGFWHTGDTGTNVDFELDRPIALEPGASYDVALISEGGGVVDLRLWPSGEPPSSLDEVAGTRLDLGDDWVFSRALHPGLELLPGASVSVDEFWGFELLGGDAAPAAIDVGMVFDPPGRGDQEYNDAAAAGLDRAATELIVRTSEATANDDGSDRKELVMQQAEELDLVFAVGWRFADAIWDAAEAYPEVSFAIVDEESVELPNVANLRLPLAEGSYLMGVAAGLKTSTLKVGFIGGSNFELIDRFEAGYVAGVRAVNPAVSVDVEHVSEWPDVSGFDDPAAAEAIAKSMYEWGADVIYHVAGGSGAGLFEAAREHSEATGTQVWAIGVDFDEYLAAEEAVRPYILTSMVQQYDVAVFATIQDFLGGNFTAGPLRFDVGMDSIGYATSGGFIDDIVDELEDYKAQIKDGTIDVPDTP